MAGRERKYTPRVRSSRPIGESRSTNKSPATPIPAPESREGGWFLPDPQAQRLHQKSALGHRVDDGILLTPEEVMFCHWYRHVPLPGGTGWFDEQVKATPRLALATIALDVLRNGGELVVPAVHLQHRFPHLNDATWAVRWERHETWTRHGGFSQIRLHHTSDGLDWQELLAWVSDVEASNHTAELCVIDDEFDTTVYHLSLADPTGDQRVLSNLSHQEMETLQKITTNASPMETGFFVANEGTWPLPALGVQHFSGRYLRDEERDYILNQGLNAQSELYGDLANRGLILRPGFKYGCRWRAYETSIEAEHAPWLVQPASEAPETWEEVCLSVRLAEGVNKRWLCALRMNSMFSFLNIKRNA